MLLFSGLAIPLGGFGWILRHALALTEKHAQHALCYGLALFRRHAEPLGGFGVILRHAFAFVVHQPQVELRLGVPLFGLRPKLFYPDGGAFDPALGLLHPATMGQ